MRKFLRSRLPERLAHRLPPLLIELGVGLLTAVVKVPTIALQQVSGAYARSTHGARGSVHARRGATDYCD